MRQRKLKIKSSLNRSHTLGGCRAIPILKFSERCSKEGRGGRFKPMFKRMLQIRKGLLPHYCHEIGIKYTKKNSFRVELSRFQGSDRYAIICRFLSQQTFTRFLRSPSKKICNIMFNGFLNNVKNIARGTTDPEIDSVTTWHLLH